MKQCRESVWWVRCTELQAGEQACWANYSLMGSFGRQLPGVNVVWRDEVRLKWNFWLENVFKWKGSRQLCTDGVGGWLWADACCCTDHHPSMFTAHKSCCNSPLLFNLIPVDLLQDLFLNDHRTFLMQYIKTQLYSEEIWNWYNYEKNWHNTLSTLTPITSAPRWGFSCPTIPSDPSRKYFERLYYHRRAFSPTFMSDHIR